MGAIGVGGMAEWPDDGGWVGGCAGLMRGGWAERGWVDEWVSGWSG